MEILKDFVKINEKGFEDYYISKDGRLVKLYKKRKQLSFHLFYLLKTDKTACPHECLCTL